MRRFFAATALAVSAVALVVGVAAATPNGADTLVTVGSPSTPFSQNKQNEPAVAVNPADPTIAAAGVNEEIDMEACNNRDDKTCPFTPGVGASGVYFSDTGGSSWVQPTYTGWTARDCLGLVGTQAAAADNCDPHVGPIGTLPRYLDSGLVSDGDPAVGFGPQRGSNGQFSWDNGWRLYYANLSSNFSAQRSEFAFKGFEAIAVSRLDSQNYAAAKAGSNGAWKAPVIVTKQNAALFSDHEMVAVDDASSSPFFGHVYVCNAAFRSQEIGGFPEPIILNSSADGGDTWTTRQVSPAVNNNTISGRQDCAVNTDSKGTVYVFWDGFDPMTKTLAIFMIRSFDGGRTFVRPARIVTHIDETGIRDFTGDLTFDGQAGARDGSFPTVDIANGAPTGADATDEIVLAWSNGPTPSDTHPGPNEQAKRHPPGADRRRPWLERKRADRRVPRRLRLRVRNARLGHGRLERRPERRRLSCNRRVPGRRCERDGGGRLHRPDPAGAETAVPGDVRQHRHLRRLVRRSNAVAQRTQGTSAVI